AGHHGHSPRGEGGPSDGRSDPGRTRGPHRALPDDRRRRPGDRLLHGGLRRRGALPAADARREDRPRRHRRQRRHRLPLRRPRRHARRRRQPEEARGNHRPAPPVRGRRRRRGGPGRGGRRHRAAAAGGPVLRRPGRPRRRPLRPPVVAAQPRPRRQPGGDGAGGRRDGRLRRRRSRPVPPHDVDLAAPAERVRRLAQEALGGEPDPADPAAVVVQVRFPTGDPAPVRLHVEPRGTGATVRIETEPTPPVPYFSWFVGPILRSADRRARAWVERALRAAEAGRALPPAPKRPSLAPPAAFSADQAAMLATVCALTAAATYGSSLLSQNVDYVGRAFSASDKALGTALAVSRAGVLIALVASAMADRRGRRRLMLISTAGVCVANAVAAVAPDLAVFTAGQTLMRGFANTALIVAGIAAIEEAPDRARAYSLALLGLAGGFG